MYIGGQWVGLGLGDSSPEVRELKRFMRRKFSYAKNLDDTTLYDQAMVIAVADMQDDDVVEEWRSVSGYPDYEVSDQGRVRSFRRNRQGQVLRVNRITNGYLQVNLYIGSGKGSRKLVHRLVLEAFVGPKPSGHEACHNDGDQTNNRLTNLRWDTPKNNARDVKLHGRQFQENKTECPRGHSYSGDNIYHRPGGGRGCKACRAEATRRSRARRSSCV